MSAQRGTRLVEAAGLFVAAGLWLAALWTTDLELGPRGFVPSLSPLWYAAALVAFGGLVVSSRRGANAHAAGYAALLAAFITLTPFVLQKTVSFPYVFNSHRYADQLLLTGVIDYRHVYLAWPGWHVVSAATVGAGGWDTPTYLQWSSVVLGVAAMAAMVMLFVRATGGGRLLWSTLIAALSLGGGLTYPLPGSMAALMWVTALVLFADERLGGARPSAGRRLLLLLLILGVTVTHLLTSVAMVASLALLVLAAKLFGRGVRPGATVLFGIAALVGFLFYVAVETTIQLLPGQVALMLDFERLFWANVDATGRAAFGGSAEHTEKVLVRIGHIVVATALALLALLAGLRNTGQRSWWFPAALVGAGTATLPLGPYVGEILARAYGYAFLGICVLLGRLAISRLGWPVTLLFGLAVALLPIRVYGNALFDHVRPQELAADRFVADHGPAAFQLAGASRTLVARWQPADANLPLVTVGGPLYDEVRRFLGDRRPSPRLRLRQYDNGDVQVAIDVQ